MVELHANLPPGLSDQLLHGLEEVVPLPVRVDEVLSEGSPPGLTAINEGGDGGGRTLQRNHHAVRTTEGAVDKVREISGVLDGREDTAGQTSLHHQFPEPSQARVS